MTTQPSETRRCLPSTGAGRRAGGREGSHPPWRLDRAWSTPGGRRPRWQQRRHGADGAQRLDRWRESSGMRRRSGALSLHLGIMEARRITKKTECLSLGGGPGRTKTEDDSFTMHVHRSLFHERRKAMTDT